MTGPAFSSYIANTRTPVYPGSKEGSYPLSGDGTPDYAAQDIGADAILVADYLNTIQAFIRRDNFQILETALKSLIPHCQGIVDVARINLFLIKHGAFYHPVKVRVETVDSRTINLAVIGAVSQPGLDLIHQEYQLLARLRDEDPEGYLPNVYGAGSMETAKGRMAFFLGQWLDNFLEFHLTRSKDGLKTGLWEEDGSTIILSDPEASEVFRQTARILTHFYRIDTMEQIFPWHHAAGDFIVRRADNGIEVRLSTVRGYDAMLEIPEEAMPRMQRVQTGLLHFFLNLTIRMRLDRLDGTKDPVWLEDHLFTPAMDGFLEALSWKTSLDHLPGASELFSSIFLTLEPEELNTILMSIADSYAPQALETQLILDRMNEHCKYVHSYMNSRLKNTPV